MARARAGRVGRNGKVRSNSNSDSDSESDSDDSASDSRTDLPTHVRGRSITELEMAQGFLRSTTPRYAFAYFRDGAFASAVPPQVSRRPLLWFVPALASAVGIS